MTDWQHRKWFIRTIRNGQVNIAKVTYVPPQDYDGRLDGMKYAFARYFIGDEVQPLLACWGPAEVYQKPYTQGQVEVRPEVVDGYIPWYFWHPKEG